MVKLRSEDSESNILKWIVRMKGIRCDPAEMG